MTDHVIGHIGPDIPRTDVPYAFDPTAKHDLDDGGIVAHVSAPGVVTQTTATGSSSQPIPAGDILHHLPVGSTISPVGVTGQVMLTVPKGGTREGPLTVIESSLHRAVARIWSFLVTEGHAIIADVRRL